MAHTEMPTAHFDRGGRRWRLSPLTRYNLIHGLVFISPWIIGFCLFIGYPIIASAIYSFTDYDVLTSPGFIGLANYRDLLTTDHLFFTAVLNTLYLALFSIPLNIALSVSI